MKQMMVKNVVSLVLLCAVILLGGISFAQNPTPTEPISGKPRSGMPAMRRATSGRAIAITMINSRTFFTTMAIGGLADILAECSNASTPK